MEILILSVTALILLLLLTIVLLKRQSDKKKLLKHFQDEYLKILRVDALDRAIMSPNDLQHFQTGPRKIIVELHEISELTDKTYTLDMDRYWNIGRKPGDNTICIRGDKTVSSVHCRLSVQNDVVVLSDLGSKNLTYYQPGRGKYKNKAWHLPQKGFQQLSTGDKFFVGYTTFEVTIFDSSYGIM